MDRVRLTVYNLTQDQYMDPIGVIEKYKQRFF